MPPRPAPLHRCRCSQRRRHRIEGLGHPHQHQPEAGNRTEAEQADNLKEFDALLAKHKGDTSDDVAKILYMKATLYLEVFKGSRQRGRTAPATPARLPGHVLGKSADKILASIKQSEAPEKIQAALVEKAAFPDFEQDLDGKPLSVAGYKGKVVMIDFWATWCRPCAGRIPNVVKVYEKYHDQGFEIIGISLDGSGDKEK